MVRLDASPPPALFSPLLTYPSPLAATVDDSLPFILNILLANIASLAGVIVVLCLTQVRQQGGCPRLARVAGCPAAANPFASHTSVARCCPPPAPLPRDPGLKACLASTALQPLVLAVLPPLAIAYRSLQRYYRATSRELRRLDAVAGSPVYSVFSGQQS